MSESLYFGPITKNASYQGTTFSRAVNRPGIIGALAPAMTKPSRNAGPEAILSGERVFSATTKTSMGRRILQSERNAMLLIEVLRSNVMAGRFQLHDFVIMPDYLHLLISIPGDRTIEKAMQLVKGGFSYRLRKEYGFPGDVWQRGFSEVWVNDQQSWLRHREYIGQNPVKAGLVDSAEQYPYSYTYLAGKKHRG